MRFEDVAGWERYYMKTIQRILVIDDDPSLGEFISAAAEGVGAQCIATTKPAEFFEHLTPDVTLVMVDLIMPNVDGVQILRQLAERHCDVNLVLMSGLSNRVIQTAQQLAITLGLEVVGYLKKPIRLLELEEVFAAPIRRVSGEVPKKARDLDFSDDALLDAFTNNEFVNHYQPQIRISSGAVVGVEALVRWQHPVHGLMFPDAFLARLESRGLMDRLWWTVARRAFSDVRRFEPYAGVQCGMSLNISVHSLQDLALPDRFSDLAKEYAVALESITIEITEGGLVKHLSKTLDVLARLRIKRVGLSIDDFGTGYSMMQQLQTIPATELKIDKSFVQKSRDSESDRIMVTKSVEIGHELGMKVVAEGVETIDQLEFLRELGCDIAQGYFFSRPKSAVELSVWLRDYSAMQMLPSPTTIINGGKSSSEGD